MNIRSIILGIICALFLSFSAYLLYFKHQWKQPASDFCDYVLPAQYYVVQDSLSGKYGILFMHLDEFPYYLSEVKVYDLYPDWVTTVVSIDNATLFDDSCSAKRCLDKLLRDKQGRRKFKRL